MLKLKKEHIDNLMNFALILPGQRNIIRNNLLRHFCFYNSTRMRMHNGRKSGISYSLDISDPHYDRKIADLERRYDEQYGKIEEIETLIAEVQEQIQTIRREQISGDNIYQLLLAFDEIYESANEAEGKIR